MTLDFAQSGSGDCRIVVEINHSVEGVATATVPLVIGGGAISSPPAPPSGFTASLNPLFGLTLEIGEILASPQFNASYNPPGTETSAELSDSEPTMVQDVLGDPNPITRPNNYQKSAINEQVVFTLNASDGVNNANDQVTASWRPRVYFGVSADPALATEADIEGLSNSNLQGNKALNFTFSATNEYVYYAFPVAFPAAPLDFQIGPFPGGFIQQVASVNVTANTAGAPVVAYQIWRSSIALNTTVSGPQTLQVSA